MAVILNFSDIGCLSESAAGSAGAGMASFVNAGFPAARGFAITPLAFSDYLGKDGIKAALELLTSGAEAPEEGWRALRSLVARTRMNWSHELEILTAFGELDSVSSVCVTSRYGANVPPVYASGGEDLLDAVKHCWFRWLRAGGLDRLADGMPAVVVREVLESEVSVEFRRKGQDIRVRAVFGLPEGLTDSAISSDIFEFKPDGTLERMEMRPQDSQYVMRPQGPSRVDISSDLRAEEKLSGDMIASLKGIMDFIRDNASIVSCSACFVSSRPIICSAELMTDSVSTAEMPPRERSISLLEPARFSAPAPTPAPAVGTMLYLTLHNADEIARASDTYLDGVILTGNPLAADDGVQIISELAKESKRRLNASSLILELGDLSAGTLERLAAAAEAISGAEMQPGILIPGIRGSEELARVLNSVNSALEGQAPPSVWVRAMYPSNLFFMGSLANNADVLLLDLDSLARLMVGGTDGGKWISHSAEALEGALDIAFRNKSGVFAAMSAEIVSTPGMLEFLVRRGTEIVCVVPQEAQTVKHIIASVEKRILLEQGRQQ